RQHRRHHRTPNKEEEGKRRTGDSPSFSQPTPALQAPTRRLWTTPEPVTATRPAPTPEPHPTPPNGSHTRGHSPGPCETCAAHPPPATSRPAPATDAGAAPNAASGIPYAGPASRPLRNRSGTPSFRPLAPRARNGHACGTPATVTASASPCTTDPKVTMPATTSGPTPNPNTPIVNSS